MSSLRTAHLRADGQTVDPGAYTEAARAWGEHVDKRPGCVGMSHGTAWDATITALVAYQKHLDSVAPAKTTTRMASLPVPGGGPTTTIDIGVDGRMQPPQWGYVLRKGDRLIVTYMENWQVTVDAERRPCDVAGAADRDFFVSG